MVYQSLPRMLVPLVPDSPHTFHPHLAALKACTNNHFEALKLIPAPGSIILLSGDLPFLLLRSLACGVGAKTLFIVMAS